MQKKNAHVTQCNAIWIHASIRKQTHLHPNQFLELLPNHEWPIYFRSLQYSFHSCRFDGASAKSHTQGSQIYTREGNFSIVRGVTPAATPLHVCAIAPKVGHGACEATPRQTMEGKGMKWTEMPQYYSPQGRTHSYGSRRVPDVAPRAKQRRWLVHYTSACLCAVPKNS